MGLELFLKNIDFDKGWNLKGFIQIETAVYNKFDDPIWKLSLNINMLKQMSFYPVEFY